MENEMSTNRTSIQLRPVASAGCHAPDRQAMPTIHARSPKSIGHEATVVEGVPPMNVRIHNELKTLDPIQSQLILLTI